MAHDSNAKVVALSYSIEGCSEHSGRYVAENIMVNNPQDQSSRWSGAYQTTNAKQWMLLRLDSPAVLSMSLALRIPYEALTRTYFSREYHLWQGSSSWCIHVIEVTENEDSSTNVCFRLLALFVGPRT